MHVRIDQARQDRGVLELHHLPPLPHVRKAGLDPSDPTIIDEHGHTITGEGVSIEQAWRPDREHVPRAYSQDGATSTEKHRSLLTACSPVSGQPGSACGHRAASQPARSGAARNATSYSPSPGTQYRPMWGSAILAPTGNTKQAANWSDSVQTRPRRRAPSRSSRQRRPSTRLRSPEGKASTAPTGRISDRR